MTKEELVKLSTWVKCWQNAAQALEEERARDIRSADPQNVIKLFDDAFRSAIWLSTPRPTSGLVELQRILAKAR